MAKTPQRLVDYRANKCRKEIYFSHQDMKEFERIAKTENTPVGVVIRNMALAYLQQRRLPSLQEKQHLEAIEEELTNTSLLIRNIANNVNQIAHRSNTLNAMVDEHGLLLHLKNLDEVLKKSIEKHTNGFKHDN